MHANESLPAEIRAIQYALDATNDVIENIIVPEIVRRRTVDADLEVADICADLAVDAIAEAQLKLLQAGVRALQSSRSFPVLWTSPERAPDLVPVCAAKAANPTFIPASVLDDANAYADLRTAVEAITCDSNGVTNYATGFACYADDECANASEPAGADSSTKLVNIVGSGKTMSQKVTA